MSKKPQDKKTTGKVALGKGKKVEKEEEPEVE